MSRTGDRVDAAPEILILQVPDGPFVDRLRAVVADACDELGIHADIPLEVGAYPSLTLLVGGIDVMTRRPVEGAARCRLDLPSRDRSVTAFQHPPRGERHADTGSLDEDLLG